MRRFRCDPVPLYTVTGTVTNVFSRENGSAGDLAAVRPRKAGAAHGCDGGVGIDL
jgi:hypothetical protein